MNECRETRRRGENIDDQDGIFPLEDDFRVRGVQTALGLVTKSKAWHAKEIDVPSINYLGPKG